MKLASLYLALAVSASALLAGCFLARSSRADQPLAGQALQTISRGQPFCTDQAQLKAKVRADVAHAPYPQGYFASCVTVPDDVRVEVIEDLAPSSRYMHVVRARAYLLFGPLDAYTYSVGLYEPLRGYQVPPPLPYR